MCCDSSNNGMRLFAVLTVTILACTYATTPSQVTSILTTTQAFLAACAGKGVVLFVGFGSSGYNDMQGLMTNLDPILRQLDSASKGWRPIFGSDPSSEGGTPSPLLLVFS